MEYFVDRRDKEWIVSFDGNRVVPIQYTVYGNTHNESRKSIASLGQIINRYPM